MSIILYPLFICIVFAYFKCMTYSPDSVNSNGRFTYLHLESTCKFGLDVEENHPEAEDLLKERAFTVARLLVAYLQWTKLSKGPFGKHEKS